MADPRDVIHQIEYRWQHEKDLSPFATTMSQPMTAGWNDSIRAWVRHPHATGLSESVCYKIWDCTGDAALAWRYRDPRAAEREDGTSGRPHVSRVLIGHASLLTPEVAIVLCQAGLPASARPHRVSAPDELPTISPDELTAAVNEMAAGLDHTAAQEAGLLELVAAALSDRDRPLAVYLPEYLIVRRLSGSPQGRLLWGLHRIMRAVPGAGRRGWSFSTFELPLGAQDAATLPDIVFRQAMHASGPPGIVRDEVKAWPFDPDAVTDLRPQDVALARWLVEAYADHGIDGVERLIADDDARDELRDQQTVLLPTPQEQHEDHISDDLDTALIVSGLASPFMLPLSPQHADALPEPASSEPAVHEPTALHELAPPEPALRELGLPYPVGHEGPEAQLTAHPGAPQPAVTAGIAAPPDASREPTDVAVNAPPSQPEQGQHAAQPQPWEQRAGRHRRNEDLLASSRGGQAAPPLPLADPQPQPGQRSATDHVQPARDEAGRGSYWKPGRIDYMLKQMREAPDPSALQEILQFIVVARADVGSNDRQEARVERQEARRIMSHYDWYDSVTKSSGYKLGARELARIFQIIVIPDLGKAEDVIERIGGWAGGADPEMICGLLMAARDAVLKERTGLMARRSRKDPVEQVRQIMLPRLASRWTHEKGIAEWWDIEQLP